MSSSTIRPPLAALADTVVAVFLYIGLEWLFFVTKPSFFSVLPWTERICIALVAALPFVAAVLGLWVCCWLLTVLLGAGDAASSNSNRTRLQRILLRLPQAAVLTLLLVLLVDNFTYTLAGIGIVSTSGFTAYAYVFVVIVLFLWITSRLAPAISDATPPKQQQVPAWKLIVALILPLAGIILAVQGLMSHENGYSPDIHTTGKQPNILFFATDGIESDFISGYGYEQQTTPNLDALMQESLVFEAAIANAARTTGSTVSMLNGKYPATTKVIFPPQTLIGADAFEHLPGLLKGRGYAVFQESIRYYADGPDLNMQQGFDIANQRVIASDATEWLPNHARVALANPLYFLSRLWQRISERALHLLQLEPMNSVYQAVKAEDSAKVYGISDRTRIDSAKDFIASQKQPFLMHIHLMDTHCCAFKPVQRKFSAEFAKRNSDNREMFFLDTLVDSDNYFGELIDALEQAGELDNTLIIYSSDHTKGWRVKQRIPLIMRFPGGAKLGRVAENVQLIDVTPTVLDYLEIPKPKWIEGRSLIAGDLDPLQSTFSTSGVSREKLSRGEDQVSQLVGSGPPLYGVESMVMTVCQRWYALDLASGELKVGYIKRHPQPCKFSDLPTKADARNQIVQHLMQRGFVLPVGAYPAIDG
ncbi:MAG: sulfatase-like hydrolase/transferase [Halioglobus sp.]